MRVLRDLFLMTLSLLLLLETGLQVVDPTGLYRNIHDATLLQNAYVLHDGYFTFTPGRYDLLLYDVTILEDETRVTHDRQSACQIVAIGDSFTFGQGVNDYETWVDHLSADSPFRWVNAGMPGYNIDHVWNRMQSIQTDGYIYWNYNNDANPYWLPEIKQRSFLSAIETYRLYSGVRSVPDDLTNFEARLAVFADAPDVLMVYHSSHPYAELVRQYGGVVFDADLAPIPREGHPSAQGHKNVYNALLPIVKPFVDARCN